MSVVNSCVAAPAACFQWMPEAGACCGPPAVDHPLCCLLIVCLLGLGPAKTTTSCPWMLLTRSAWVICLDGTDHTGHNSRSTTWAHAPVPLVELDSTFAACPPQARVGCEACM